MGRPSKKYSDGDKLADRLLDSKAAAKDRDLITRPLLYTRATELATPSAYHRKLLPRLSGDTKPRLSLPLLMDLSEDALGTA
jgi:hypothetical protein